MNTSRRRPAQLPTSVGPRQATSRSPIRWLDHDKLCFLCIGVTLWATAMSATAHAGQNDGTVAAGAEADDACTAEVCDGVDNNCNGYVDEGLPLDFYYQDLDGDGFGNPDVSTIDCGVFAGWAERAEDCDDQDGSQHPEGVEVCNYEDDDCDGEVDEEVRPLLCFDGDMDGWADATNRTLEFCTAEDADTASPFGQWGTVVGDCDDENGAIHPDSEEICDGLDNDCDGVADELPECGGAATDTAPDPVDGDGDGFSETQGDCDDTDWTVHPGAPEICDGKDNNCECDLTAETCTPYPRAYVDEGLLCFDGDADGFSIADGDCDDEDPLSFPAAEEDPGDDRDNDCDGNVDEDETVDRDGDGFSEMFGDCDDDDDTVGPGSAEVPGDYQDNDCDGLVDEPHDGLQCTLCSRNASVSSPWCAYLAGLVSWIGAGWVRRRNA